MQQTSVRESDIQHLKYTINIYACVCVHDAYIYHILTLAPAGAPIAALLRDTVSMS